MDKLVKKARLHAYVWVLTYVIIGIIFKYLRIKYGLNDVTEIPVHSPLHWIELFVLLFTLYPWLWYVRYLAKKASWKTATILSTANLIPFTGWLLMNIILSVHGLVS